MDLHNDYQCSCQAGTTGKLTFCYATITLNYVPGGHGNPVSGHRGQNGMDVRQRGGTEWANVTGRDCRGCRARFLNCQKICHGSHGADEKPTVGHSKTG